MPVEQNVYRAIEMAESGKDVVCFNFDMYDIDIGRCGCVMGFYEEKTHRSIVDDFPMCGEIPKIEVVFDSYRGKGDTVV